MKEKMWKMVVKRYKDKSNIKMFFVDSAFYATFIILIMVGMFLLRAVIF